MPKGTITELVTALKAGQIASFPTDTVPALAVLPQYSALIFALKQRSEDKPLILMGASAEELWPYVTGTLQEKEIWQQITRRYWPGQLTLVLPAGEQVPKEMNTFDPTTIGIRVPNCQEAQRILAQTGPLATTSANLSKQPPLLTMTEIALTFPDVWVLELSEKEAQLSGLPSTVAKWTIEGWQILRQGAVSWKNGQI